MLYKLVATVSFSSYLTLSIAINYNNSITVVPMKKLIRNLMLIKEDCGEVCDTSDNFFKKPGIYFDQIVKNFQCAYLFESPIIENNNVSGQQLNNDPPDLDNLPKDVQQQYTFDGRIPLLHHYLNDIAYLKDSKQKAQIEKIRAYLWERKNIEIGQESYRNHALVGLYGIEVVANITRVIKEHLLEHVCM